MIISFGSKENEKIWKGDRVKNLPGDVQQIGRRKLRVLNNSQNLVDLRVPPSNKSANSLSKDIGIPQTRTSEILKGNRSITADTALRLNYYFGNSAKFWLGLQNDYDLEEEKKIKARTHNTVN